MLRFIVRRVLLAILTLFAISIATFAIFFAAPSNPAEANCGKNCDRASIERVEKQLEIDRPIVEQYTKFVSGIFVGRTYGEGELARECPAPCLGFSFRGNEPVLDIVKRTVPITVSIVLGAAIVWLGTGIALGM